MDKFIVEDTKANALIKMNELVDSVNGYEKSKSKLARQIGGTAYQTILSFPLAPSLDWKSFDYKDEANGAPPEATFTRASGATFTNAVGEVETVGNDILRHDYDPITGEYLGWLIEEERTNFLLNSDTPVTQTVSLNAGDYILWVVGTGSCTMSGGQTGTATEESPVTFSLVSTTLVTFTVSGSLDRFQNEDGLFQTSYIPTTATPETRAADNLRIATVDFPYNQDEGTILSVFDIISTDTTSFPRVLDINNGTSDNRVSINFDPTNKFFSILIRDDSVTQAFLEPSDVPISPNVFYAISVGFKLNSFGASQDGEQTVIDNSGTVPNVNILFIGQTWNGFQLNGHIRHMVYFPRRLSDSDLQKLTR